MPPEIRSESDNESDEDVIQPKKSVKKQPAKAVNADSDAEEEDAGAESDVSNEYTVEAIMDHKFAGDDGNQLFFHVKWQDYPKKSDWTWEPEDHLKGGSDAILQEYYKGIGGRPVQKSSKAAPASSRKRGRQSTAGTTASATPAKSAKKPRTSITAQAVAAADDYSDGEAVAGVADEDKKWKPPAGNWEEHIAHIDTIEKTDKGLVCYVQWSNGRKSQHDINTVYKKCPQRMLYFYEQHLVFKETGTL